MILAPFRVSWIDEPRYGRFYFVEAFGIVRTLYLDSGRTTTNPEVPARVHKTTFRWDYRVVGNLAIKKGVGLE